ncbi:MAG: VIT1/CCC1 transporter family protein [Dysgonomonas sp.]
MILSPELKKTLLAAQQDEVTSAVVYRNIAKSIKNEHNKDIINKIASVEDRHAALWKSFTKEDVAPRKLKVFAFTWLVRIFGITFGLKLMEKSEKEATIDYDKLSTVIPQALEIKKDEQEHEMQLIDMVDDKSLNYLGSVVLGLNDALVELTGVLAGLTFGLQNGKMIASVGIITGISAALSMAGSEYLSTKTDGGEVKPLTASTYTGLAYIVTVVLLILPYLLLSNIYVALGACIGISILIIAVFNYYTSVAKNFSFKSRFLEMAGISLGVAFISFIIGLIVKQVFSIDV